VRRAAQNGSRFSQTLFFALLWLTVIAVLRLIASALLLLPLGCLTSCGSQSDDEPKGGVTAADCEGRGDAFVAGMSQTTRDQSMTIELVSAEPAAPANTDNFWTLALSDSERAPVDAATVVAVPYMVDHGHGAAAQLAVPTGNGQYDLGPLTLTMPGYWEIGLEITLADGTKTSASYDVCVVAR
jgi:hypothetical protein